jgi:hypothetical protein
VAAPEGNAEDVDAASGQRLLGAAHVLDEVARVGAVDVGGLAAGQQQDEAAIAAREEDLTAIS